MVGLPADADFVSESAGFEIGGVPPAGHATSPLTLLDQDQRQYETIRAAGGTPNAVFRLTWNDLLSLTAATVADVAKAASA